MLLLILHFYKPSLLLREDISWTVSVENGWKVTGTWVEGSRGWWRGTGPDSRREIGVGAVKKAGIRNGTHDLHQAGDYGPILLVEQWQETETTVLVGTVGTRHLLNGKCGVGTSNYVGKTCGLCNRFKGDCWVRAETRTLLHMQKGCTV